MLNGFTYKVKNRVLLTAIPVFVLVFYFAAFRKTYNAVKLHHQLNEQISQTDNLSFNPSYSGDKLKRINTALNQYKVDTIAWREDFWMLVSGMASEKSISVVYDREKARVELGKGNPMILDMEVNFVGKYRNLVQLVDNLERNNRLGLLSGLEMTRTKDAFDSKEKKIVVKASFKVVSK